MVDDGEACESLPTVLGHHTSAVLQSQAQKKTSSETKGDTHKVSHQTSQGGQGNTR